MRTPDVNLLVYARSRNSPHYARSREWLHETLSAREPVAFAVSALIGFVRIKTHPRLNDPPLSAAEAFDQVDEWLAQAPATIVHPGRRHLAICRDLLVAAGTAGDLTSDAHLAALAIEHGARLASFDSDFHRFPGLDFEFLR